MLVCLWVLLACISESRGKTASLFCGGRFTTKGTTGNQWRCRLAARPGPSIYQWSSWVWACMKASQHWMTSHFKTACCLRLWTRVPLLITSTVRGAEPVWNASGSVTLWMTVEMEVMRKTAVSLHSNTTMTLMRESRTWVESRNGFQIRTIYLLVQMVYQFGHGSSWRPAWGMTEPEKEGSSPTVSYLWAQSEA